MAETERLLTSSEIYLINGTEMNIDVYVNYESQPTISDPTPLAVGPVFVVEDTFSRPYGVYTFSVRLKGDPGGPVLAEASVDMQQGHSFSGVFHPGTAQGEYRFSIYENDLSEGTDARLTVRNTSDTDGVDWSLVPNGENPEIPSDTRSGTLGHGEWQIARGVTENDYLFEWFIDGDRVAREEDLNLGLEENVIVYLLGHPVPATDPNQLEKFFVNQELEYDVGPAVEDSTSTPAPPRSDSDGNAAIQFDCPDAEFWETNPGSVEIGATDPDGVVVDLSIERVDPPVDGFTIEDGDFTASPAIGQAATATLSVAGDVPDGSYAVRVAANAGSLAQSATCTVDVEIRRITVQRLKDQVSFYEQQGAVTGGFADQLQGRLDKVANHLGENDVAKACADLEKFTTKVSDKEGSKVDKPAAEDLIQEADALKVDLACG